MKKEQNNSKKNDNKYNGANSYIEEGKYKNNNKLGEYSDLFKEGEPIEIFIIDGEIQFIFSRETHKMLIFEDNHASGEVNSPQERAEILLSTRIKYFTTFGMNPDEFGFILDNHIRYKNIKYANIRDTANNDTYRIPNTIWELRKVEHLCKNRDYEIVQTYKETKKWAHWGATAITFNNNTRQYNIFDSQQYNNKPFINVRYDKLETKALLLNNQDIQGNSNLCWLYTLEFMKKANEYTKFEDLKADCTQERGYKLQKDIYNNVNDVLSAYESPKELSELVNSEEISKAMKGGNKKFHAKNIKDVPHNIQQHNPAQTPPQNTQQANTSQTNEQLVKRAAQFLWKDSIDKIRPANNNVHINDLTSAQIKQNIPMITNNKQQNRKGGFDKIHRVNNNMHSDSLLDAQIKQNNKNTSQIDRSLF